MYKKFLSVQHLPVSTEIGCPADEFLIETGRWPRPEGPVASHIENAQHLRWEC